MNQQDPIATNTSVAAPAETPAPTAAPAATEAPSLPDTVDTSWDLIANDLDIALPSEAPDPGPAPVPPKEPGPPVALPPTETTAATPPAQPATPQEKEAPPTPTPPAPETPPVQKSHAEIYQEMLTGLEKEYALSEEESVKLDTEPSKALPAILARVHLAISQAMAQGLAQTLPGLIQQQTQQHNHNVTVGTKFANDWPQIKALAESSDAGKKEVLQTIQYVRGLNPQASVEDVMEQAGKLLYALKGWSKEPATGTQPAPAQLPPGFRALNTTPPPPPGAAFTGSAGGLSFEPAPDDPWSALVKEFEEDFLP